MDAELDVTESAKLVTEGLTIFESAPVPDIFGDGNGLSFSASLLEAVLGLENSFIFDLSVFNLCSFSGISKFGRLGEIWVLRGNAAFAAVAAAAACPPIAPL